MEGITGAFGLLNKLLEFFQQKAFVYVDVSFGTKRPYAITVVNRSRFDVHLLHLSVDPDGFPTVNNGWSVNDADLFRDKMLKPGQTIRLCLTSNDIGTNGRRTFVITYLTIVRGKRIRRYEQTCTYDFDRDAHSVRVTSSATINYDVVSKSTNK